MPYQKEIYPLTTEQAQILAEQNTDMIILSPLWSDELNGIYIHPEDLDNPDFSNHKAAFDNLDPKPVLTEITIKTYFDL